MLLAVWVDSVFVLTCDLVDFVTYLGLQSSLVSCVLRLWGVGLCALCGFLGFGLVVVLPVVGFCDCFESVVLVFSGFEFSLSV